MTSDQHHAEDSPVETSFWRAKAWWGKVLLGAAIGTLVVLFAGWAGYPKFKEYQRKRTIRAAENFLQTKDYRSAYLLLDQLTKREPGNFEAHRLFARVLDVYDPAQALVEWEMLVKHEPENAANHVGYITLALSAGQLDKATGDLPALQKLTPQSADYHRLAAAVALARRDTPALRRAMEGLAQAEQDNTVARFGLASLQLGSADPGEADAARAALEEFARGDKVRIRATLVLLGDLPRRWPDRNPLQARRLLARQLALGLPVRSGEKQYLWAGVKNQYEPDLVDIIQHMQNQPAPLPEDIALLAGWMIEQRQAREALVWLESLDPTLRATPRVLNALAACTLTIAQWTDLEKYVQQGAWGPVPAEAVRYAFEAHRVREAGNESQAETLWNNAVRQTETSLPGLRMLVRLAGHWQWPRKMEQALWTLVQQFPFEQEAWQKLAALSLAANDSAKTWRVYTSWAQANPTNETLRLNRAVLGIFIRPNEPGINALIEEIHHRNPANPGAQLGQAMVYWRAGRAPDALALLDRIPLPSSAEPRLALARGLVLASLGRASEAEAMFRAVPESSFLPDEIALISQARKNP